MVDSFCGAVLAGGGAGCEGGGVLVGGDVQVCGGMLPNGGEGGELFRVFAFPEGDFCGCEGYFMLGDSEADRIMIGYSRRV